MHEDSSNPYEAPTTTQQSDSFTTGASVVVACVLWALLSVAMWFGNTRMWPLYSLFELELPPITQALLHPASPLVPLFAASLLGIAAFFARPRERHLLSLVSIVVAFASTLVAVYFLFAPLVNMIYGLAE